MARHSMLVLLLAIGAAAMPADVVHVNPKKLAAKISQDDYYTGTGTPSYYTTVAPSISDCACNLYQVWNDVIFIVDTSEATTNNGVQEIWGTILSMLGWNNVNTTTYTQSNYYMRVGVITYATQASVFANLGQYDYFGLLNFATLPFSSGDSGTNLEQAIQLANDQFNSAAHRSNSKKVIVVMATTYNDGSYSAPQQAAKNFREDGGILQVYNYIQVHGTQNLLLQELSSPGYFFDSLNNGVDDLNQAQCDSNCFCAKNQAVYGSSLRNFPVGGCYTTTTTQVNGPLSKLRCQQQNGVRAIVTSDSKNSFLAARYPTPTNFYIGLQYSSGQWVWDDGTYLGSYHPWYNGVTPPGTDGKQCVYVTASTNQWVATACQNAYDYNCQLVPCDSTNYCASV